MMKCFSFAVLPDDRIVHGLKAELDDMAGLMTALLNPARQRRWKLGINEEVHAA